MIEKSRSIAQLLLADVREAVSEIRESDVMDIAPAIAALNVTIPSKTVELDYPSPLEINNIYVAEAILALIQESITNFMRHSSGDHYQATVSKNGHFINVVITDNGKLKHDIAKGNGINGLAERVSLAGGTLQFLAAPSFGIRAEFRGEPSDD